MNLMIQLRLDHYDTFVSQCDQASRYYSILKNGIIVSRPKENCFERVVIIRCTTAEALALVRIAKVICPSAIADIQQGLFEQHDYSRVFIAPYALPD